MEIVRLRKQLLLQSGKMLLSYEGSENESFAEQESLDYGEELKRRGKKGESVMDSEKQFKPNFEIDFQELIFDRKISEGGYGIVYKGRWKSTVVALKEIKKEIVEQDKLEEFRSKSLRVLTHRRVPSYGGHQAPKYRDVPWSVHQTA